MRFVRKLSLHCAAMGAPFALLGCAAVDARPDYDRAAELITSATGEPEAQPLDDESIRASTRDAMLQDGLTLDEVVKLALLNNPAMAVQFFEIGIARADLVQSGLFSNPTFGLSVQCAIARACRAPTATKKAVRARAAICTAVSATRRIAASRLREAISFFTGICQRSTMFWARLAWRLLRPPPSGN